jgi:hypothetical protein
LLKEAGRVGVAMVFAALERVGSVAVCSGTRGDEAEASRLSATLQSIAETQDGKAAVVRGTGGR